MERMKCLFSRGDECYFNNYPSGVTYCYHRFAHDHVYGCENNRCNRCVALSKEEVEIENIESKAW